jgi:hypothetical protein
MIDARNKVLPAPKAAVSENAKFGSEAEFARLASDWAMTRLADVWNSIPGVEPVTRFKDRKTAIRRIWAAIQDSALKEDGQRTDVTRKIVRAKRQDPVEPAPITKGTKTEQIIALIKAPSGATLKAIMAATGWQPHSVRGFVSAQLIKRMGLRVKSIKRAGERVYLIQR